MAKNDLKKTVASFFEKNKKLLSSTVLEDIEILASLYYNSVPRGHKFHLKKKFLHNQLSIFNVISCSLGQTLKKLIREAYQPLHILNSNYNKAGWKASQIMLNDPNFLKEENEATVYYIRISENVNQFYVYLNDQCRNDIMETLKSHEKRVKK